MNKEAIKRSIQAITSPAWIVGLIALGIVTIILTEVGSYAYYVAMWISTGTWNKDSKSTAYGYITKPYNDLTVLFIKNKYTRSNLNLWIDLAWAPMALGFFIVYMMIHR